MSAVPTPGAFDDLDDIDLDAAQPHSPPQDWLSASVAFATKQPSLITCPDCRGSGKFYSYAGRLVGQCFKCSGTGKSTAPRPKLMDAAHVTARAKDKEYRAKVKVRAATAKAQWFTDHADVLAWIKANDGSFDFATSLSNSLGQYGALTENQVAAVRRCIARDNERTTARQAASAVTAVAVGALDLATVPEGCYAVPNGDTRLKVRIDKPSAPSKWADWVFVRDAAVYGEGKRYGKQRPGGVYEGEVQDALRTIAADPKAACAAYGKLVGRCGVCGRPLEDKDSVERGIGPICFGKF